MGTDDRGGRGGPSFHELVEDPEIYAQLRRIAHAMMRRESPGHTLQPTEVVHEMYAYLSQQERVRWQSRGHVLGVAALHMRRFLSNWARNKRNRPELLSLHDGDAMLTGDLISVVALDRALSKLESEDDRMAQVVVLRFLGGLTVEETAAALEVSPATVKRLWRYARAWLHRELSN